MRWKSSAAMASTLPAAAREALLSGAAETPKPGNPGFARCESHIIATAQGSLAAAAELARARGVTPLVLGDAIEGEAREAARVLGGIALSCAAHGVPLAAPCVLLSGGETTVTVRGKGRGGRNAEFLLGLALALGGACAHFGHRLRYGRHRRFGRQCRCHGLARYAGAGRRRRN